MSKPSKTADKLVYNGPFQTQREHELTESPLENFIRGFEAAANTIALNVLSDENVRSKYGEHIKRISNEVRGAVQSGEMTVKTGAEFCNQMRDKLFEEYRTYTSAFGVAKAEVLKAKAKGLDSYLNRYAQRLFRRDFLQLSTGERQAVYFEIIGSAGRDNASVTNGTKNLKAAGTVALLLTGVLVVGEIFAAKDRIAEAVRQGSIIAGGIVGGTGGAAMSFLCGPAEPACVVTLMVLGSDLGAKAGLKAYEVYSEQWQVFRTWMNN
ncbi:hypothetical protein [Caballeronia cordobensis]|uniref:hypothetical protein n=1 Tax=Caballeronia cordobensis TaxID=1353886 RepID=UPI00045EF579|nr:uncharacterized protein BRPE67_BCDS06160 [Burkholderia sp. RPE67]